MRLKQEFFDFKTRSKIAAVVLRKAVYGAGNKARYALCSLTDDGRPLTKFVTKKEYDSFRVPSK